MSRRYVALWALLLTLGCRDDVASLYGGEPDAAAPATALELFGDDADCTACLQAQCGQEVAACDGDAACASYAACQRSCADPPCQQACAAGFDGGWPAPTAPVTTCAEASCAAECSVGRDFACAGNYSWEKESTPTSVLRLQLGDLSDRIKPRFDENIRVRVCRDRLLACEDQFGEHFTDEIGRVELTLPHGDGNNQGYSGFDGMILFDDPDEQPARIQTTALFLDRSFDQPEDEWIDTALFPPLHQSGQGNLLAVVVDCRSIYYVNRSGLTATIDGVTLLLDDNIIQVVNLEPGGHELVISYAGDEIRRLEFRIFADVTSYFWLWPATATD